MILKLSFETNAEVIIIILSIIIFIIMSPSFSSHRLQPQTAQEIQQESIETSRQILGKTQIKRERGDL